MRYFDNATSLSECDCMIEPAANIAYNRKERREREWEWLKTVKK